MDSGWQVEKLLKGLTSVPKCGTPGRIVVYGLSAKPILTGVNKEDVLIAAAQLDKGRIVVFSQSGYAENFKDSGLSDADELSKLQRNVKLWVSRDSFKSGECILNANSKTSKDQLHSCKIAFWAGGSEEIPSSDLLEFIRKGGGFVLCVTPWVTLGSPGKKWKDIPYWEVLSSVGVCFTADYINVDKDTKAFPIEKSKASGAHLLECLKLTVDNFDNIITNISLVEGIQYLPDDAKDSLKGYVTQHWGICSNKLHSTFPNGKIQTKTKEEWALPRLWQLCSELSPHSGLKAPCIAFPGDFEKAPKLINSSELTFKSERKDIYPTGCYAPAGSEVIVRVSSGNEKADWQVIIGAHTDSLDACETLSRYPRISKKISLDKQGSAEYKVSSYFGGSIYFLSPDEGNSSITAQLLKIVEAPIFNSKNKDDWKTKRNAPGLWADVSGEFVTITLPADSVREIDDPSEVMKMYDDILRLYHDLRGTDVSQFRRQWIVTDEQPNAGEMHAGYPIVTHMNVADPGRKKDDGFLLDATSMKQYNYWAILHEIGHNMQQPEWKWYGTVEVSCNIFTLCAMDEYFGRNTWIHPKLQRSYQAAVDYLKDGANYEKVWLHEPITALFIYAQLATAFGWKAYRKVFREYQGMEKKDKPVTDQEKIDKWYEIFSMKSERNLIPLVMFWGIPLSDTAKEKIEKLKLPGFLPDDELTKAVSFRAELVKMNYPGSIQTF